MTVQTGTQASQATQQAKPVGISSDGAAKKIANILSPGQQKDKNSQADNGKKKQDYNQKKETKAKPHERDSQEEQPLEVVAAEDLQEGTEDQDLFSDVQGEALNEENADQHVSEDGGLDQEEPTEGDQEDEKLYTVKISGEKHQVPLKELIDGYQRQSDYTRNMKALAKDRRDLEAQREQVKDLPNVLKANQESTERFTKNSHLVLRALERFMPHPPSAELAKTDPASYIHQKEMHQEALHLVGGIQRELTTLSNKALEDLQGKVKEGRVRLFEAEPEMKDPAKRQQLREYALAHGFTDEQIKMEPNHVLFQWAWKARKWDELQKAKVEIKSQKPLPKVATQDKAVQGKKSLQERQHRGTMDAHRKVKSLNSAAMAINSLINKKG